MNTNTKSLIPFSLDFGNRKAKLISPMTIKRMLDANSLPDAQKSTEQLLGTKIFPSFFMDYDDLGDSSTVVGNKAIHLDKYQTSKDTHFQYAWGEQLYKVHSKNFLTTIGIENRYNRNEFAKLVDFSLGELARDYQEAYDGILEVSVIASVPTEDKTRPEVIEQLSKLILGDHNLNINDESLNIRVKEVQIEAQPIGSAYNEVLDMEGFVIEEKEHLLEEQIAIIDIGGGTLLIDTLTSMKMNKPRAQTDKGATVLYDYIRQYMVKDGITGIRIEEIEYILFTQDGKSGYTYAPSKNVSHDITPYVEKAKIKYTNEVLNFVSSTLLKLNETDSMFYTGGTSNLIDHKLTKERFDIAQFVQNPEVANPMGFYKKLVGDLAERAEQQAELESLQKKAKKKSTDPIASEG